MAKQPAFKIPKNPGACADLYFTLREKRLALQKEAEALEEQEKIVKMHLIDTLPKSDATGAAGKLCRVQVVTKKEPTVTDWDKFRAHVVKSKAWEMLGKTLGKAAIKERWEAGKEVPGVGTFDVVTLSVSKI